MDKEEDEELDELVVDEEEELLEEITLEELEEAFPLEQAVMITMLRRNGKICCFITTIIRENALESYEV